MSSDALQRSNKPSYPAVWSAALRSKRTKEVNKLWASRSLQASMRSAKPLRALCLGRLFLLAKGCFGSLSACHGYEACWSSPMQPLVRLDANDWSGRMQTGGQVNAITQLDAYGAELPHTAPASGTPYQGRRDGG